MAIEELVPMTDGSRRVLELAVGAARAARAPSVQPEHLLLALAEEQYGVAGQVLILLGADHEAVSRCVARISATQIYPDQPILHDTLDQLQRWAGEELVPLEHHYVGTEHLLLALTRVSSGEFPRY
jgi:ATP-dependent Clp protease ATP-binding subunit ClpC